MIPKLDGLTTLLLATIFATFLLFSCAAKQAPREIIVTVPANFSGELSLSPCSGAGASAQVTVDAKGAAATSVCPRPGETVVLTVVKAGKRPSDRIPPEEVNILRAGDGLPVAIRARVNSSPEQKAALPAERPRTQLHFQVAEPLIQFGKAFSKKIDLVVCDLDHEGVFVAEVYLTAVNVFGRNLEHLA
jgi:hypothetical protein